MWQVRQIAVKGRTSWFALLQGTQERRIFDTEANAQAYAASRHRAAQQRLEIGRWPAQHESGAARP